MVQEGTAYSLPAHFYIQFGAKNREDGIEWEIKEVRTNCRSAMLLLSLSNASVYGSELIKSYDLHILGSSHAQVIKYYETDVGFMAR
jgi:hypothetical protein